MKKLILCGTLLVMAYGSYAASPEVTALSSYSYPENVPAGPGQYTYMPDGVSYAMLSPDGKAVELYELTTGKKTGTLVDVNNTRENKIGVIEGFTVSPDGGRVLIYTGRKPIYRRSFFAQYYVYEVRSRLLRPLSTFSSLQRSPVFSPDGRMVAFVTPDNNIRLAKFDYNTEIAVTEDGAVNSVINGVPDWTYEEEFSTSCSMTFAPDNATLCFIRYDESAVPTYTLPVYQGTCAPKNEYQFYPGTYSYKYPVAGETNSTVTVHAYDIDNRKTMALTLPDSNIEYIPRIIYGHSADALLVATLNRDQNRMELYSVNPRSGMAKSVFVEETSAWVTPETYENITADDKGFVVTSTRTGYAHLYHYSYAGALTRSITSGEFDVTAYYGADAAGNFYYQAAAPSPLVRSVYKVDVKGKVTPLSGEDGWASANFTPGCSHAVVSYSTPQMPPVYTLISSAGKNVRLLEDNASFAAEVLPELVNKEFFTFESEGVTLNGYILHDSRFTGKRPVIISQYSGPGSQSVKKQWQYDWEQYFASQGYVIVCVDPRGTGGRGRAFMDVVYKNLGYFETIDLCNAARYIAAKPYADAERIGIYGWSYGGYQALMCITAPDTPFTAAVAIAPVTDWRFYDTVYAERYMLTPRQNYEGYRLSAPLNRTSGITAPLLIMTGTSDDNVHPANSLQFMSQLQSEGILADFMSFPNMNHSINGCNARSVVYGRMLRFFNQNLR
ncbi:MAG: S9 family peptidase [Muribaculaceae bacterium]|nr:S9 family peptidase [Muribaculaceae bacterium]